MIKLEEEWEKFEKSNTRDILTQEQIDKILLNLAIKNKIGINLSKK